MNFSALALTALVFLVGCASASRNERQGLLQRLGNGRASESARAAPESISEIRRYGFAWPLKQVAVNSPFGRRGFSGHEGVDLKASVGTSVYAAQSGTVVYAGSKLSGYGKLIVIRHREGLATVYAHNSKLLVLQGSRVTKGQKIALSGKTGHVTGPHLHFEVRNGETPIDPMEVMPAAPAPPELAQILPSRKRKRSLASSNQ